MAKKNNDYWLNRRDQLFNKDSQLAKRELAQQYLRLYQQTQTDLLLLLEEIEKNLVHEGGINERTVLPSDLYRADSYYRLMTDFVANSTELGNNEIPIISKSLTDMYKQTFELTTTELGDSNFQLNNPDQVEKVINSVWCPDGKTWSDRIWVNQADMASKLEQGLIDIVASGKSSREVAVKLTQFVKDDIDKGFRKAYRLVQTELSYVQVQSCLDKYQQANVNFYQILSMRDDRTCDSCAEEFDGQIFKLSEAKVGINCPPFHPNCRCTTLAVLGGNK